MKMSCAAAAKVLGIVPLCSADTVRRAYAAAVMADHPDHGGTGARLATLQEARDAMIMAPELQSAVSPCVLCHGVGKTRGRFGAQTCTACGGSGETK